MKIITYILERVVVLLAFSIWIIYATISIPLVLSFNLLSGKKAKNGKQEK